MKKLILLTAILFVLSLSSVYAVSCGDTITTDTVLDTNLNCIGNGLTIEANDITLDCDGHTLTGPRDGAGIIVLGSKIEIRNCIIKNFYNGIWMLPHYNNNTFTDNFLENNAYGIYAWPYCNYTKIYRNNILNSSQRGIYTNYGSNYEVFDNNFLNNLVDFIINSDHTTFNGNHISGNQNGGEIYGDYNLVFKNNISYNHGSGIGLSGSNNLFYWNIVNNNYYGVLIKHGTNNKVYENNFSNNIAGIYLFEANYTDIHDNNILHDTWLGISLIGSHHNNISMNKITGNKSQNNAGISIGYSFHNIIEKNIVYNERWGIGVGQAYNNSILNNDIISSDFVGIYLDGDSVNNLVLHNNFINNSIQAYDFSCLFYPPCDNFFDNGFEGNYWNNYDEESEGCYDVNYDGICDSPYLIEFGNRDNYPFTHMNGWLDSDNDSIPDSEDKCPNTIGEQLVYGCSCEQILKLKPGEDTATNREGCSKGIVEVFTKGIGWAKDLFG